MGFVANFPAWAVAPVSGGIAVAVVAGGVAWHVVSRPPVPGVDVARPATTTSVEAKPTVLLPEPALDKPAPAAASTTIQPLAESRPLARLDPPPALAAVPLDPPVLPTFDIVRVEPGGDVLVAGRGSAGTQILLMEGETALTSGTIDGTGQFVLLPPKLQPGSHLLTLKSTPKTGKPVRSVQDVAISVPENPKGSVVAALAEPGKPTQVLSGAPQPPAKPATPPATGAATALQVSISTVDVEQGGGFFATGIAAAGSNVRLYLNGSFIAAMVAGADGHWSLKIAKGMQSGHYLVRADQVDGVGGNVTARAEVPFDYSAQPEPPKTVGSVVENALPAIVGATDAPPKSAANAAAILAVPETPKLATLLAAQPASALPESTKLAPVTTPPVVATAASPELSKAATPAAVPKIVAPASQPQLAEPLPVPAASALVGAVKKPTGAPGQVAAIGVVPSADVVIREIQSTTVIRGDSLWRISRNTFGQGIRYTQIYEANTGQIRDPRLIYPGQVLVVPSSN